MVDRYRNEANNQSINWGLVIGGNGKVYPGDVDGMLERKGRFLFLEWKHSSVDVIPQGQMIAYERLDSLPECTVAIVFGCYQTWQVSGIQWVGKPRLPFDNAALVQWMREWWKWASANPAPPR